MPDYVSLLLWSSNLLYLLLGPVRRTAWTMDINLCGLLRAFHFVISQPVPWLEIYSDEMRNDCG